MTAAFEGVPVVYGDVVGSVHRDVAFTLEVAHCLVDGFTGRADDTREVVLGEAQADASSFFALHLSIRAVRLGEHQKLLGRCARRHPGTRESESSRSSGADGSLSLSRGKWRLRETEFRQAFEIVGGENHYFSRFNGDNIGGTARAIQQREFAEEIAGLKHGDNSLVLFLV